MATILITGGTGLIGSALTKMLTTKGHKVIVLSRSAKSSNDDNVRFAKWDVKAQTIDEKALAGADYIIHLAGAGVADKRWSKSRKKEIQESRTESSKLLIKGLQNTPNKVKAVISASAIGWYGDDKKRGGRKAFIEEMPADTAFLGETCRLWEESIEPVEALGKRLVKLRIGIVLSNDGGALPEFKKPVKFGLAAAMGSGDQVVSWIHIEDVCRMFVYAIEHEEMIGVYNAVAPNPVKNKSLMLHLAQKIKGKFYIEVNVPAFVLKLMLGEMSVEVLKSTTVSSEKISKAGFTFLYPSISRALDDLLSTNEM